MAKKETYYPSTTGRKTRKRTAEVIYSANDNGTETFGPATVRKKGVTTTNIATPKTIKGSPLSIGIAGNKR